MNYDKIYEMKGASLPAWLTGMHSVIKDFEFENQN